MQELAAAVAASPGLALLPLVAAACLVAGLAWRYIDGAPAPLRHRRAARVGLAFGLAGLCVFLLVAMSTQAQGRMDAFDRLLAEQLAARAPPALLHLLSWFTHLGDRDGLIVLGAAVLAVLVWRRHGRLAILWAVATAGGGMLNRLLKEGFARVRPEALHGYAEAHGWSFPSGHATGAMAVYGMLCYVVLRLAPPRWHLPVLLAGAALITAIGWSRVVLQVHYFSDVAAAFGVTGAWLALCIGLGRHYGLSPGARPGG